MMKWFLMALMLSSGCDSDVGKDPVPWEQQRYTGAPEIKPEKVDDFGSCSANDLINFSCD